VKEIGDHYGDKIAAFEILNEANNWYGFRAKAENVGILTGLTYARVKPTRPATKFLLGATIATGDPRLDHVSYLQGIYNSEAIKNYKENGYHYEDNLYPFDGVAWHPYFTNAFDAIYTVDQAIGVMRKAGDNLNKLWITETGLEGTKDNNNCVAAAPGKEDVEQGEYLYIFYSQAAQRQKDIGAVFWFKFEDFYDNGQLKALGMVHLAINKDGYAPHGGKIVRYKPAYSAYQRLAAPILPITKVEQPARSSSSPDQSYYFAPTGHTLSGTFLNYWLKNGGADLFGLPLTEPYKEVDPGNGKSYLVQWFERERFELHPENAGTKYEVLLGLLGSELIARSCRSFSRAQPLPPPPPPEKGKPPLPERSYFNATGHNLVGSFKEYWEGRGGLAVFGYPISEEFGENSPTDGKFYVVQYFERARFELHPDARGTPYEVQLGLLGSQALVARAWK